MISSKNWYHCWTLQMKNIVNKYSEAETKVWEATSNDPWGPSSSLTTKIANLTYNMVAFSKIMSMVWKRLNDHSKNWQHVYKELLLLDYLIKTAPSVWPRSTMRTSLSSRP
uniref:ENTH domain-containing protein n=1 Tax=Theropithecus gelada TaxID=9565 RepID=A0A8D2FQ13_THEGE